MFYVIDIFETVRTFLITYYYFILNVNDTLINIFLKHIFANFIPGK